jgi:hypothetical protein
MGITFNANNSLKKLISMCQNQLTDFFDSDSEVNSVNQGVQNRLIEQRFINLVLLLCTKLFSKLEELYKI